MQTQLASLFSIAAAAFGLLVGTVSAKAQMPPRVEEIAYGGWQHCYKISNGTVNVIVTADVGPRVIYYGFNGDRNEFHQFPDQMGKTGGTDFRSYGGHRLWVAPENDRTYFPDNVPVKVVRQGGVVKFIAPVELKPLATHLQREIDVRMAASGTEITLIQKVANRGARATRLAPWSISVMEQHGTAILPLPPKAPWDKQHFQPVGSLTLWSYTDFQDPRWTLGTKYVELHQDTKPTGRYQWQKIGVHDVDGWGAYFNAGHLFVKRAGFEAKADYSDYGANFETYTDPTFLELETLGPMQRVAPGATVEHTEHWWLFKDVPAGRGDAWVDANVLPRVKQTS
ncbi:MAG: hypothetical protein ACRD2H_14780 [Terriglobales bacterium]